MFSFRSQRSCPPGIILGKVVFLAHAFCCGGRISDACGALFRRFRLTLDRFLPIKKAYSLFCEGNKLFSSGFIGFDVFCLLDTFGAELKAIADDGEATVKLHSLRFGQINADIVQDAIDFIRDFLPDSHALFA